MMMGMLGIGKGSGTLSGGGGGGGGASISALFGDSQEVGFATPYTTPSITFTAGFVVVALFTQYDVPATACTIKGVTATQIGTTVGKLQLWGATVTAGTGTVSFTNGSVFDCVASCGWTLTGLNSTTPTAAPSTFNTAQADPQGPLSSLVIPTGGVAVVAMGTEFNAAAGQYPVTWSPAAVVRDAVTEKQITTGNKCSIAGAHLTTAGTYTNITASGATVQWNAATMIGAAFQ